jgi:hypothetical protein
MTLNRIEGSEPFESVLVELWRQRDIADDTIRALEEIQAVLKAKGVLRANWQGIERTPTGISVSTERVRQLMGDDQLAAIAAYEFLEIELATCLRELHGRIGAYIELAVFTGADRASILLACGRSLNNIENSLAEMELLGT